ncbi:MAG: DUF2809 domain-containing protein [Sphingobacteriaceae bacterium]|nr:MAG: DUF2809 domain-containing protein [Sphingobacteriaceae bacterium]
MLKPRLTWLIIICITIMLGLASRHFSIIPLFVGDILWATMVCFIVRFLFINKPVSFIATISLLFSFAIEISQLYKAPWIDSIRPTLFGRLVLGATFNWGDMICYTVGVVIGVVINLFLVSSRTRYEERSIHK